MGFDTIITGGTVVTAADTCQADVAIENGRVTALGSSLPRENAKRLIDAKGKYVFPGGIDVHTHLDMPFGGTTSADDFETGTRAAAFGGTTTLIDFAIQYKGQTLRTAFDAWMQKASSKAVADYGFHCIITDLPDAQLAEMPQLVREGITSFKLFMAYPGVFMLDDASIFKAMRTSAKAGAMVCMHAENGGAIDVIVQQALAEGKTAPKYHALTRPTTAEAEAVSRAIALAEMAGSPVYIVHLSCNDALEKVREARDPAYPCTPKPALNICICHSKTWTPLASKARSMSSPRRCAKNGIKRSCGRDSLTIICKSSRPTTARSVSRSRRKWASAISPRFPTEAPASNIA